MIGFVFDVLNKFPTSAHPMTQLTAGIMALQVCLALKRKGATLFTSLVVLKVSSSDVAPTVNYGVTSFLRLSKSISNLEVGNTRIRGVLKTTPSFSR